MKWIPALLSLLLLSGCGWHEADELSVVTAAAVESSGTGTQLTLEIARPSASDPVPSSEKLTALGRTASEAIETASSERDLYLSHAELIILDESSARTQLNNLLTYAAEHSDRLRLGTRLCIAKDCTPSAILDSRTTSGEPAGYALSRTLDRSIQSGLLPDLPAYQLIDRIKDPDIDAVIPVLSLRGDAAVPGGCAVLRGRAIAGYLSQTETELLCLLLGSAESASYPLSTGTVLLLSSPDCKIEALDADRPVFRITLTAQTESGSRTAAEQALTRELDALLTRLYTEYSADPLGLMREMRRTQPDRYEQLSQTAPSEWEIRTTVHLTGGGT